MPTKSRYHNDIFLCSIPQSAIPALKKCSGTAISTWKWCDPDDRPSHRTYLASPFINIPFGIRAQCVGACDLSVCVLLNSIFSFAAVQEIQVWSYREREWERLWWWWCKMDDIWLYSPASRPHTTRNTVSNWALVVRLGSRQLPVELLLSALAWHIRSSGNRSRKEM